MRHLGYTHGTGILKVTRKILARVVYDFDGFLRKPEDVIGSGEIRMPPDAMRQVFAREDLHLLTGDGRLQRLRFSEKHLPKASDDAHVEVAGDLPSRSESRN